MGEYEDELAALTESAPADGCAPEPLHVRLHVPEDDDKTMYGSGEPELAKRTPPPPPRRETPHE